MGSRVRLVAAIALGLSGGASLLAAACAIEIADVVPLADAQASETGTEAGGSCLAQSCDSDDQCCPSAPRCTNARTCAVTCATLDSGQCSPPECCLGLFCENYCRACHEVGSICSTNNSCCNNNCVAGEGGSYCR